MHITQKQVTQLLDALRGATPAAPKAETQRRKYHVGAVWHGDWRVHADRGRFGTPEKPRHYACIMERSGKLRRFTLSPVTSREHTGDGTVHLPAGLIPGKRFTNSWLLASIRLQVLRPTLDRFFDYRCSLPSEYVREAKEKYSK